MNISLVYNIIKNELIYSNQSNYQRNYNPPTQVETKAGIFSMRYL